MPIVGTVSSLSSRPLGGFGGGLAGGASGGSAEMAISKSGGGNAQQLNNGDVLTVTVTTEGIADGTTLYYVIVPVNGTVVASDFTSNSLTGTFTVTNNTGSFTLTVASDSPEWTIETFVVQVRQNSVTGTQIGTTTNVNIQSASATIGTSSTNINEGSTVTFTINTTNIANGTNLYCTINGVSSSDFTSGGLQETVTIQSNSASFTRTAANDTTTEGTETFNVSVRRDSYTGTILDTTDTITINDTSQTYTGSTVTFTNPGHTAYSVPSQASSVTVKCWGAGGTGSGECNSTSGGGGGYNQGSWSLAGQYGIINVRVGANGQGSPQGQAGYGAGRGGEYSYILSGGRYMVAGGGGGAGQAGYGGGGAGNGCGNDGSGVNVSGTGQGNVNVTFQVNQSAGASNNIHFAGHTFASNNTGSHTKSIQANTNHSVSTSGSCDDRWLQVQSGGSRLGLDDCNPGGDGDYNDLTVTANNGSFSNASGGSATYRVNSGGGNSKGTGGCTNSAGQAGAGPQPGNNGSSWNSGNNLQCGGAGGGTGGSVSNRGGGGGE